MITCEIKMKFPSLNEYINVCRGNRYQAAKMKRDIEAEMFQYIYPLPKITGPIMIHFRWTEGNSRRDLDNIAFGKKFVLDALVKYGKLKDDNRKNVWAFRDSFEYGAETKLTIEIYGLEEYKQ